VGRAGAGGAHCRTSDTAGSQDSNKEQQRFEVRRRVILRSAFAGRGVYTASVQRPVLAQRPVFSNLPCCCAHGSVGAVGWAAEGRIGWVGRVGGAHC
jgi:hypothetical protein